MTQPLTREVLTAAREMITPETWQPRGVSIQQHHVPVAGIITGVDRRRAKPAVPHEQYEVDGDVLAATSQDALSAILSALESDGRIIVADTLVAAPPKPQVIAYGVQSV